MNPPSTIVHKRSGSTQPFDLAKLRRGIEAAFADREVVPNGELIKIEADMRLEVETRAVVHVDELRDQVTGRLTDLGLVNVAQAYQDGSVISRARRESQRSQEAQEAGRWQRVLSTAGVHPFDTVKWRTTDAVITKPNGSIAFEQRGVEVPEFWSQQTVNIVADKFFRMVNGVRENSARQMFTRVVNVLVLWADDQQYFSSIADREVYRDELLTLLLLQYGAFNSPVWFNLGVPGRRQAASACFISSVEDNLDAILDFQKAEVRIFAGGSGSGFNVSSLRSSWETIEAGAYTSGPLSWMEAGDKFAKAMKSGGGTRNAAKMVVMDAGHPDILKTRDGRPGFVPCKAVEEKRAHRLIAAGDPSGYDDPNSAYKWVSFQNANHSVRANDEFMTSVKRDLDWPLKDRHGNWVATHRAREIWDAISEAAWVCGDPGMQFETTINSWHTTPVTGPIRASNPCSEFLHCDDTACNLAALNLVKFFDLSNSGKAVFEAVKYQHCVRVLTTAQSAIIAKAAYPTAKIEINSHALRPIGLNYGNLGALLMQLGLAYDSDAGRNVAARLASLMTAGAYLTSARIAARTSPFSEFAKNREPMLAIMQKHREADALITDDRFADSGELWNEAIRMGERHGYNISQATLQAPLGTISFLMGMDTTGIEPAYALIAYKTMVGGGAEKLVCGSVKAGLRALGYPNDDTGRICDHLTATGTMVGSGLDVKHLPVFDTAAESGGRCISPDGHMLMMAAIQPLITCAQSKTVNLPNSVTPKEIGDIYMRAWELGIKCIALYRDGCKASQPMSTKKEETLEKPMDHAALKVSDLPDHEFAASIPIPPTSKRRRMPIDCNGKRHRFDIAGHKGYIMVNEYDDGTPGEVFMELGKEGSTMSGLVDGFTKLLSLALQYGLPLEKLVSGFAGMRFEPCGITDNSAIRNTSSIFDYLVRLMAQRYLTGDGQPHAPTMVEMKKTAVVGARVDVDAPPCSSCGSMTQRNGRCYVCITCGTSSGCS